MRLSPMTIIIGIIVLIVFFYFGGSSLFEGDSGVVNAPAPPQQPDAVGTMSVSGVDVTPAPAATRVAGAAPAASGEGQTWLVMLYQDADDKVLEQDIYVDLNEAERVGSSDRVHIVAQLDRYRGGYQADGDWTGARRFYVTHDEDLERVGSEVVADLGEVNMADANTLVDFVTWAVESYPADRHLLILSDHGMGWPGGWSDPDPRVAGDRSTPLGSALGNQLYLMHLDDALAAIRSRTGLDKLELVGLDACLMSHLEVYAALAPHARYAVASQETEPALGWAYTGFLQALVDNPEMDGAELGRFIIGTYIEDDQRIVDPEARADLLRQNAGMGGMFGMFEPPSAATVVRQMGRDVTLSAVDLGRIPAVMQSLNNLTLALQGARQQDVAKARSYAQSFTNIFGSNLPAPYLDLGNFAQLVRQASGSQNVSAAVDDLIAQIGQAVIAEKHGPNKPGATGLSIYFPNSTLFNTQEAGPPSYMAIARRFAAESLWDDYLLFHYTGREFDAGAVLTADRLPSIPQRSEVVNIPGAGQVQVSELNLSGDVAAPGQPVLLSADISGENIGYIYIFAGFIDAQSRSIFVADMDYLESGDTREAQGVYYPDWGEGEFTLEFEWEPLMFAISDGAASSLALLTPEQYGASAEAATYSVEGIYTYADGETRRARLYFANGVLLSVFGFTNEGDGSTVNGAPREIIPSPGDRVTILEQWMDLDTNGAVVNQATQEGDTLTFTDQTLVWQELDAAVGPYIVGLIVEDLDGQRYARYAQVTVE